MDQAWLQSDSDPLGRCSCAELVPGGQRDPARGSDTSSTSTTAGRGFRWDVAALQRLPGRAALGGPISHLGFVGMDGSMRSGGAVGAVTMEKEEVEWD